MPVHQQVADLAVGSDAAFVAADLEIGVVGGVGKIRGGGAFPGAKEAVVGGHVKFQIVVDPGAHPGGGRRGGLVIDAAEGAVAVAEGHKIGAVLEFRVGMNGSGQERGKIGVPFRGDAHAVGHFVADGEGQGHVGNLGIDAGFAGQAEGDAGDAHGGIHIRPAQLFHRQGGAGENGVEVVVGQRLEAFPGLVRQRVKVREGHIAAGIPADLQGEGVGLVPVELGGFGQLLQIVAAHIQPHIVGQGAGVVIQTPEHGVEHVNAGKNRDDPPRPLNGVPFQHDHQHDAGKNQHAQRHSQQLPDGEVHAACPLGKNGLRGADDVGVHHIHQGRKPFTEPHQHPGDGAEDGGGEVAEPIFQRKRLL